MLSPNAEAFRIENLLGLKSERGTERTSTVQSVRNICPPSAGEMQCIHPARQTVHGLLLSLIFRAHYL